MQGRCQHDQISLHRGNLILFCLLFQLFQQHLGQNIDMMDMRRTLAVSEFYDLAQNIYHNLLASFFFLCLIRQNLHQPSLLCIQLNGIEHSITNDLGIKWSADIIRHPHLISLSDRRNRNLCRNHDHRNLFDDPFFFHPFQHTKSIHHRHYNIQQYQRNLPAFLFQNVQSLLSVGCFQNIKRFT